MRTFNALEDPLDIIYAALNPSPPHDEEEAKSVASKIISAIRSRGDAALLEYVKELDWPEATLRNLALTSDDLEYYEPSIAPEDLDVMDEAAANILAFHTAERGRLQSWMQPSLTGPSQLTGQLIQPVHRAGIYVPGGKAAYPSAVLMCAIPALVAGVSEVIICTPPNSQGEISPHVGLVASRWSQKLFKIGGAQAIAAMAYGTETVPRCDVIVGPGNKYVTAAKKLVYGDVGIDMIAGPSELAIVADEGASPALMAADLLAQTEHGPDNRGIAFCHSRALLDQCRLEIEEQSKKLSRQEILHASQENMLLIQTQSLKQSIALANELAPEHLELMVREPLEALPKIRNAGAILLGDHSSAPFGDYWAGPSHTLPTGGTARYSSPLSCATFMKTSSIIYASPETAAQSSRSIARLAQIEGFDGHEAAALRRSAPS